jgi:hypothetical protein
MILFYYALLQSHWGLSTDLESLSSSETPFLPFLMASPYSYWILFGFTFCLIFKSIYVFFLHHYEVFYTQFQYNM